jgi:exodeoxyribonuclease VII large subunit
MTTKVFTIYELNKLAANMIQTINPITVQGEISSIKIFGENAYLLLKDNNSIINAVVWNNTFTFQVGDRITVTGSIDIFCKTGIYKLVIQNIIKDGIGNLHINYEKLKTQLKENGLFDKKRKLPTDKILSVGLLTSKDGSVLQDILHVFRKNNFVGKIFIKNCIVQGSRSVESIKNGLKYFWNIDNPVDVIVMARGGGSFEDLISYSDESVLKMIYDSPIVTISAIGHETDYMLSDFVADIRTATPSLAAELLCESQLRYKQEVNSLSSSAKKLLTNYLDDYYNKLSKINIKDIIDKQINELNTIKMNIDNVIKTKKNKYNIIISTLLIRLQQYDLKKNMKIGCILYTDDGNIINSCVMYNKIIEDKKPITIMFSDGKISHQY